jgi:hypothetical protein
MEIVMEEKLNIYKKLQKCRMELNKKKLTKSGHNTYSNYKYFELSDFLPVVNELFYENGLSSEFNLYDKAAVLKIIDVDDNNSQIIFKIPIADATIKGSSPIQALGGQITYLRRYLYINALEIAENDLIDKQDNKMSEAEQELILVYMDKMEKLEMETESDHEEILKYFKVKSNQEMTLRQFKEAVAILEKKKSKNKEEVF